MKRATSILMATLVLMAVMHLSVATHYCGGKLAAVKFSITAHKASCGMEDSNSSTAPCGKLSKKSCCKNEMVTMTVDTNFSPSFFSNLILNQNIFSSIADFPVEDFCCLVEQNDSYPNFSPPEFSPINSVDLATNCVFRI